MIDILICFQIFLLYSCSIAGVVTHNKLLCFSSLQKKVDPFVSTVHLPHAFKAEMNRVLVFTEVKTFILPSLNLHFVAISVSVVDELF